MSDSTTTLTGGTATSGGDVVRPPRRAATDAAGSAGAEPTPTRVRRPTTNIRPNVGKRDMKEYPLTDSDIETLGLTKGGSTFFFSIASLLIGYVFNTVKDAATWELAWQRIAAPLSAAAIGAAIVCVIVASYLWYRNGSTIRRIKHEVKFD